MISTDLAVAPPFMAHPAYVEGASWLVHEANLLNSGRYEEWLTLLAPDLTYRMPARASVGRGREADPTTANAHYDESYESMRARVRRLQAVTQWAENPPSRSRRLVVNIELVSAADHEIRMASSLLFVRSRFDAPVSETFTAQRDDRLIRSGAGWLLADRLIGVDQETLAVVNIAVPL